MGFVHGSWHAGKRGDLGPAGSLSRPQEDRTYCGHVVDGRRIDHGGCSFDPLGRKGSRQRTGLWVGPPNCSNSRPLTGHRLVLWRHPVSNASGVPVRCGQRNSQGRAHAGVIARPGCRCDEQAMACDARRSRILRPKMSDLRHRDLFAGRIRVARTKDWPQRGGMQERSRVPGSWLAARSGLAPAGKALETPSPVSAKLNLL